ncbi:MAG TPA: class I SAM-dependent methyltransferase [Nitrospira sp.]|nr:class I SAM-dependent methyltransferase [Nitrospira sp.]
MEAIASFRRYVDEAAPRIDGWVDPEIWSIVLIMHAIQTRLSINGGSLEIGVHHGKFLLGLERLTAAESVVLGIDVFENQHLNIDGSGCGDRTTFENNVHQFADAPGRVKAVPADSLSIDYTDVLHHSRGARFRLVSVDGGHTAEHTLSDLRLTERIIAPGGIVFLDDYYNADWPGVHEGFVRYLADAPKLVPVITYANKMVLCHLSWHRTISEMIGSTAQVLKMRVSGKPVSLLRHPFFNVHTCLTVEE